MREADDYLPEKLTGQPKREAIKRRDKDGETLRSIGRSYNVSAATISRLTP
jgi:hypothetical protein